MVSLYPKESGSLLSSEQKKAFEAQSKEYF